ncbi:hypothetical protein VaNZ11_012564, partial [Volvox africanus]
VANRLVIMYGCDRAAYTRIGCLNCCSLAIYSSPDILLGYLHHHWINCGRSSKRAELVLSWNAQTRTLPVLLRLTTPDMRSMAAMTKLSLLQLERCRLCFLVATRRVDAGVRANLGDACASPEAPIAIHKYRQPITLLDIQACALAAGLEAIRAQLRRARWAADAATAASAAAARSSSPGDFGSMTSIIVEAAEALTFVAAAVTTPGHQLLVSEATEGQMILSHLALTFSGYQQYNYFSALDAVRRATMAKDSTAAAFAAHQAQDAAGLAIWAARLVDLQHVRELGFAHLQDVVLQAFLSLDAVLPADLAVVSSTESTETRQVVLGDLGCIFPPRLEPLQKRPRLALQI